MFSHPSELVEPESDDTDEAPGQSAAELAPSLSEKWKSFTPEEKLEYTKDAVKELEERRQSKAFAVRNVGKSCLQDASKNLESIKEQVR